MINFQLIHEINEQRCRRWHKDYGYRKGEWTGSDWSNAMMGEAGEAANVVKKLRRAELNLPGALDAAATELERKLADELADAFLYLDLLAGYYGINLPLAIAKKFNAVSVREGFPERLPEQ